MVNYKPRGTEQVACRYPLLPCDMQLRRGERAFLQRGSGMHAARELRIAWRENKCAARTYGGGVKHVELFPLVPVAHFPLDDYAHDAAIESAQMASTDLSMGCMSQLIRRGVGGGKGGGKLCVAVVAVQFRASQRGRTNRGGSDSGRSSDTYCPSSCFAAGPV